MQESSFRWGVLLLGPRRHGPPAHCRLSLTQEPRARTLDVDGELLGDVLRRREGRLQRVWEGRLQATKHSPVGAIELS